MVGLTAPPAPAGSREKRGTYASALGIVEIYRFRRIINPSVPVGLMVHGLTRVGFGDFCPDGCFVFVSGLIVIEEVWI